MHAQMHKLLPLVVGFYQGCSEKPIHVVFNVLIWNDWLLEHFYGFRFWPIFDFFMTNLEWHVFGLKNFKNWKMAKNSIVYPTLKYIWKSIKVEGYGRYASECLDINECMDVISPCQNHECVNTMGTYYCKCFDGFEYDVNSEKMSDDLSQCVNINECGKRIHKCDSGRGRITYHGMIVSHGPGILGQK